MTADPEDSFSYEYLLSLAAAQVKAQPTWEYDTCPGCGHKWHGLRCEACPCPTAVDEAGAA